MEATVQRLLARLRRPGLVLDVGAGRGRDALALLGAGHRVEAVDLVATDDWMAIEQAWPECATFIEGDVLAVPLGGPYDGILDNGCLHHQHPSAYAGYLAKLATHAKPGATLVVSFFTPADGRTSGGLWLQHDGRLTKEFTEAEVRALLRDSGWHAVDCAPVPRTSGKSHYLVVTAERREAR
jgi:SAM-dependent methyltransferase